ncbi:MAG: hypothetical protein Q4C87_00990 [Actinomycetaceae bacterium]|nr:hypothetical protein [Actinomycetaceae bacterium]
MLEETFIVDAEKLIKAKKILRGAADSVSYTAVLHYWLTSNSETLEHLPFHSNLWAVTWSCAELVVPEALQPLAYTLVAAGWPIVHKGYSRRTLANLDAYSRLEAVLQYIATRHGQKEHHLADYLSDAEDLSYIGADSYLPGIVIQALRSPYKQMREDGEFITEYLMTDEDIHIKPITPSPYNKRDIPQFETVEKDTYREIITAAEQASKRIFSISPELRNSTKFPQFRRIIRNCLTPNNGVYESQSVTRALHLLDNEGPGGIIPFARLLAPLTVHDEHSEHALQLLAYMGYLETDIVTREPLDNWLKGGPGKYAHRLEKIAHIYSFLGLTADLEKVTIQALCSKDPTIRALGLRLTENPFFTNDPLFFRTTPDSTTGGTTSGNLLPGEEKHCPG